MLGFTGINRLVDIFGYVKDCISDVNTTIANKEGKVHYGSCSTAAATATKVITVDENSNFTLKPGAIIVVKFTYSNTASSVKLNVAGTGAKSIWYNTAAYTSTSAVVCGTAKRHIAYVYDGTYWVWIGMSYYYSYSNASLGQGYGLCVTEEEDTNKIVTLSSYSLTAGGVVIVNFTNAVPTGSTMNINSKGALPIYYHGAAITDGVIKAGDNAMFMYYSTNKQYILICTDAESESSSNGSDEPQSSTTVFNDDGSITETFEDHTVTTAFNDDGSITETRVYTDKTTTITTVFNDDGSITTTVS
jgi:hypothetical protein